MYCFVAGRRKIDFPDTAIKHARKPEQTKENTSCNWIIKHPKSSMYAHVGQGEIPLHFTLLPLSQVKGQGTRIESRVKYQNPRARRIIMGEGLKGSLGAASCALISPGQSHGPRFTLGAQQGWEGLWKRGEGKPLLDGNPILTTAADSWMGTENMLQGPKFTNIKENDEKIQLTAFV